MIGRRLVNGMESSSVAADDRGLQYGDGLFETMLAEDGRLRHLELHLERLATGCQRLGLPMPAREDIESDCERVLQGLDRAAVKLIVTRGPGPRGYRPPVDPAVTRIVTCSAAPVSHLPAGGGITLRMCETRLGLHPDLAGIKHLNRLEQVLAAAEWQDTSIAEGLMLSADGRVVCAIAANLFLVMDGTLWTPAIRDCGVAGVTRRRVMRVAAELGIDLGETDIDPESLARAEEIFLTSALTGIRPVTEIAGLCKLAAGPITAQLAAALGDGGR